METFQVNSAVWQEGRYFVAQSLNAEVSSFGKTIGEALANLQEALDLYFDKNSSLS